MKKTLIILLSVLTVVFMATAALAVEVSYEGEVSVKWGGNNGTDGDHKFEEDNYEAFVNIDLEKDFGDGVTAGAKIKLDPTAKSEVQYLLNDDYDKDKDDGTGLKDTDGNDKYKPGDVASADAVKLDGAGWIQLDRDLFTLKASTSIDGGVGKDFGEYGLDGAPGLGLDLKLIDGLTVNTLVNAGPDYRYLIKGEFAHDLFTLGGGLQNDPTEAAKEKTAFGFYGTANVIDGLAISAEYGNRKEGEADAFTAILGSVSYDGLLNATASFLMQDKDFKTVSDDDEDVDFLARDLVRNKAEHDYSVIFTDVTYNVTDDFELNGAFDYILSAKDGETDVADFDDEKLSYKVGAAYTFDALKVEGWYKARVKSQVGGKATYTLADGVDTSFELTYGKDNKDADGVVSYTAKITAAL